MSDVRELLRRYDRPGPRYTSYPPATEFAETIGPEDYARHLAQASHSREPLSLYLHLPFCEERCLYCGCTVVITKRREVAEHYLEILLREVRDVAARLGRRHDLRQVHWGGGTPSYLDPGQMRRLHETVRDAFRVQDDAELAIEVDPRVTTSAHLETLAELGFRRLSIGVQDFTPEVQRAVRREQPFGSTRFLVDEARSLGFDSLNVDLIYGLPLQTRATFANTLGKALELRPDRVAVYGYAHVPWVRGHQRAIDERTLPGPEERLALFAEAVTAFGRAGYRQVGMDHFARPDDELARASEGGTLWRNFMGYTVRSAPDVVACGMSAISDVAGGYFQNRKKLARYEQDVEEGRLPVERGRVLNEDDHLRRHVITALMCNFRVGAKAVERQFDIDFWETFEEAREELAPMEADGLVRCSEDGVFVNESGQLFVRNVCMAFDAHLRGTSGPRRYSRTV